MIVSYYNTFLQHSDLRDEPVKLEMKSYIIPLYLKYLFKNSNFWAIYNSTIKVPGVIDEWKLKLYVISTPVGSEEQSNDTYFEHLLHIP